MESDLIQTSTFHCDCYLELFYRATIIPMLKKILIALIAS